MSNINNSLAVGDPLPTLYKCTECGDEQIEQEFPWLDDNKLICADCLTKIYEEDEKQN